MSKAMEALDTVLSTYIETWCKRGDCTECDKGWAALDVLASYITTTEARIKELEEALKRLCPDGDIGEGLSSGYTLSSESILAARAALAKAEGRP